MAPRKTPALDAFANVDRAVELQARWVQIDADAVPTALPDWSKLGPGAWSHVASPAELTRLDLLGSLGAGSVFNQKIYAKNNQAASLSFSPFVRIQVPLTPDPVPLDEMIIPPSDSIFDSSPYIPNLAKPESKLPEMAPMPGAGGKNDSPFASQNPYLRPQMSPELADLMAYKFQLRPTLVGDRTFTLELKSLNSADNVAATATLNQGETVVFSLPNILMVQSAKKIRRTFLLVTPRLATPPNLMPKVPILPTP